MTSDEAHLLHMEQTMRIIDRILEKPTPKMEPLATTFHIEYRCEMDGDEARDIYWFGLIETIREDACLCIGRTEDTQTPGDAWRALLRLATELNLKVSVGRQDGPCPSEVTQVADTACPLQEINIGREFTVRRYGEGISLLDFRRSRYIRSAEMTPDQARDIAAALWSLAGEVQP